MKLKELCEGAWALPDTRTKVDILANALRRPFTKKDVETYLWQVMGDDDFMDDVAKAKPDEDVRPIIKQHLRTMLQATWFNPPPEDVWQDLELLAKLK